MFGFTPTMGTSPAQVVLELLQLVQIESASCATLGSIECTYTSFLAGRTPGRAKKHRSFRGNVGRTEFPSHRHHL